MKEINIALFILVSVYLQATAGESDQKPIYDLKEAPELFDKFIQDYNKQYKDSYDLLFHYEAFKNSLRNINRGNSVPSSVTFDINQFTDYTPVLLKKLHR